MAVTQTDLVNKSLTLVGATPITSITDDTNNARIANRVYEISLRSILSECKWNFATTRATLTVSAEILDWYDVGETIVYVKPTDMIRIFEAHDPFATRREEGDFIISDTATLGVRYVYFLNDPSKYPGYFIEAFSDKLASDIAYMIVNSASLGKTFFEKYENVSLPKAIAANSQTGFQQGMKDDAWELAKHHNGQPDA